MKFTQPSSAYNPNSRWWKRPAVLWVLVAAGCLAGFFIGFLAESIISKPVLPAPLRLGGYNFISPLLACNFSSLKVFPEFQKMSSQIESVIKAHTSAGDISKASTYFLNLANGNWSDVNEKEKYYPSSLGKIPIMMAYYGLAESSNAILDKKMTYVGGADLNQTQDIKPAKAIVPGDTYTVEQLIEYMIEYSDNNATELLYNAIDKNTLRNVYSDLNIPTNGNATIENLDFITPQQITILFRVLYNATYLSRDYSEKALQLMSKSGFTQGVYAGVPASTVVSHKLGLVGIAPNGIITDEHELHDCGIIYAKDPYVLCVMTRGSSNLSAMENIVAEISKTVYKNVINGGR